MRFLYLAGDAVPGRKGASVRIERTVSTLRDLGHAVRLFTPAPPGAEAAAGADHTTVRLPAGNYLDRALALRRAAGDWLAASATADVVQVRGIWEGVPAIAWADRSGADVIFEAHGFPSVELPYHYPQLRQAPSLLEKLIEEETLLLRRADLVLTPSQTGRLYLRSRGVPEERIAVVPNAVDPTLFAPSLGPPPAAPPLRLVYVGTLAPWQGVGTLLEALAMRPRHAAPAIELHAVGPARSSWRRTLRASARALRVHHLLHLSPATSQADLVPLLQSAHICVAPLPADVRNAAQGCCPLKVLEYMATGRPILATRIPPLEELLEHRRTAWLAPAGSPAALNAGLDWLAAHADEREEMGQRARQEVLARGTPRHFAVWLSAALERLAMVARARRRDRA